MYKLFLLFLLFLFQTIFLGYADYVNVSSCQTINSTTLAGTDEVRLNADISNYNSGDCFDIETTNFTFDCQGHIIDGTDTAPSSGIHFFSFNSNNVSAKNCIITDFNHGVDFHFASNNTILNMTLTGNLASGIRHWFSSGPNYVINSSISSNLYGVYFFGFNENQHYFNTNISENSNGIAFAGNYESNNTFTNISLVNNTNYEIIFAPSIFNTTNTTFQDSYLGNFSKIENSNWSLNTAFFYDNTFLSDTAPTNECFDLENTTCNVPFPAIISISESSLFPIQGVFSLIILSFSLLFFLF